MHHKAFGDWPPAGYVYLVSLTEAVLGLKEISVRLPAAIIGSTSILLIYLFSLNLFRNRKDKKIISLMSAFFLAILPWHIILSRSSSEDIVANFLVLLGLLFLVKEKRNYWLAFLSFILSFYFYFSSRIIVVLVLMGFLMFRRENQTKKRLLFSFLIIIIICLSFITFIGKNTRFNSVSIFGSLENKLVVEEQIREDGSLKISPMIARLFHNKPIRISKAFLNEYSKYFNLNFLILEGGLPERYLVPDSGLILSVGFIFMILGIIFALRNFKYFYNRILLWLLIIVPVAGAMTWENSPNIRRVSFWIFVIVLLQSIGFVFLMSILKRKKWLLLLIMPLIFELFLFFHQATVHVKVHMPWYRNIGYQEMINYLNQVEDNYSNIYVSEFDGDPYIFFLFYNKIDPSKYQELSKNKPARLAGENDKKRWELEKYIFLRDHCPMVKEKSALIIGQGDCKLEPGFTVLKKFYRTDNSLVFLLYYYDK